MKKAKGVHVALEQSGDLDGRIGRVISRHRSPEAAARAAARHAHRSARAGRVVEVATAVCVTRPVVAEEVQHRDTLPLAPQPVVSTSTIPAPRGRVGKDALAGIQDALDAMRRRRAGEPS